MPISKRKRFEVFKRDGFKCQYCGRTPPDVVLECDHVIPQASGGTDDRCNLTTACHECNSGKSDKHLIEIPASVDAGMALEIERRSQTQRFNRWLMDLRKQDDASIDRIARYWGDATHPDNPGQWRLSDNLTPTVRIFLKSLPEAEILDAIDITASKTQMIEGYTFKYFCGVCWRKIKGDNRHA